MPCLSHIFNLLTHILLKYLFLQPFGAFPSLLIQMSDRFKKIFLGLSIVVPFLIYSMYYYGMMVKNAPYKFSEFQELTFKYGLGGSLLNQYNSRTTEYQYVTESDSIVKKKVKLTKDD